MGLPGSIHPSWENILLPAFEDKRYLQTRQMMLDLHEKGTLTPHITNIYRVFEKPVEHYKVVIIGLSPYWTITKLPGDKSTRTAIGRAFAVPYAVNDYGLSPSLSIIIDALRVQYDFPELNYLGGNSFDVTLEHWEEQGVLLLNRYLTSELLNNDSKVHEKHWSWFTDKVIENLADQTFGLIFHLWGKQAQELEPLIVNKGHHVIKASHPQASNYNSWFDFPTENVFLQTDEITKNINNETIKWY